MSMNPSESTRAASLEPSGVGQTRRDFLIRGSVATASFALPCAAKSEVGRLKKAVKIGVIADLHHDVMHDGRERMEVFAKEMENFGPDAVMQLGDFAYPNDENRDVIQWFNGIHEHSLHVLGNHDTDRGHTKQACLTEWGMPARYYHRNIEGIDLIVLDGNEKGSPSYKGGYVSYLGKEQVGWLKEKLGTLKGPIIVVSHQPLAGYAAVDNAEEIQELLGKASDRVILAVNGHSHVDEVVRIHGVSYLHVNSASYLWVGGKYQHESYPEAIHAKHPSISYTCPYRDCVFATLVIDPECLTIQVTGRRSEWVGKSPAELGVEVDPSLSSGDAILAGIRDRKIEKSVK
ncbi:metallophosphoesterase [Haloferula rosea]|uniref:Metallophosphoesterase n=2 Tax=Haloferula rosea TaxID=490093 RepID=A0A934RFI2_9BACT|nr:metallophosphoesterase [Haloferula rosea]